METPDDLVSVYGAASVPEAHLIKNVLEAEGISARVSEVTAYPAEFFVEPDVWVRRADESRAQSVLADYERLQGAQRSGPDWTCPTCGNQVPGSFDQCDVCHTLSGTTNPDR
jgi:putative signal transducing protein